MIATLPLAKQLETFEALRFTPEPGHPFTLYLSAPDARLADAVRALFPGIKLLETQRQPQAARSDSDSEETTGYAAYWGPPAGLGAGLEIPDVARLPSQGYRLTLAGPAAALGANDAAGLFYGLQTLRQLLDLGDPLPALTIADWPDTPLRCMNYDLRQTFSKPELLVSYVDAFAAFKTNALLIEYEDKFPFARHAEFRHPAHALTDAELDGLLDAAARNFIEVIPLQQTFGHLEYILGRDAYRHLRETASSTGELCPSHPDAFGLVAGLLEEIAARHPNSRYLHLGCDEVYSLCECPICREKYGGSRNLAFLDFVNKLIDYTCGLGKKPIIWQDILADCSDEELGMLDPRVAVMIWHYNGKNIDRVAGSLAPRLQARGIEVMGAPSVRCFDRKDDQNYPLVRERMSNVDQWAAAAEGYGLSGLVGTNWTAVFSLGVPYGVFETTWYTMAYFADAAWHRERPADDRFIDRFLQTFHGIAPDTAERLLGSYDDEDYYASMPKLLGAVAKHEDTSRLIAAMIDYETAADRSRTIHKYAYRRELYPDSEAEGRSLANNCRITRAGLDKVRPRMEAALRTFQPADMAEHYMRSRFYLHDYLDGHLYKELGLAGREGE
ncbi:family 20 glycosylhydrolase [Cohnella sp. GCM10012308]|uniref:family 20 glycosylhydrolase n=1 Tax=Cohnella sp. GCM10012308 TaxID=3317329 RepID=UPI00362131B0